MGSSSGTNASTTVIAAAFDDRAEALRLRFRKGIEIAIPIAAIREIATAPIALLRDVQVSAAGDGVIFRELGEVLHVSGLLLELFGDAFAGALGKIGGRSRSEAKVRAARKNGCKGGRPRKVAAVGAERIGDAPANRC